MNIRHSLYWDDFNSRADETVSCLKYDKPVPVRRVAIFITDKCNMSCAYCNSKNGKREMSEEVFKTIFNTYKEDAILHITGGEPSTVKWLYPFIEEHGSNARIHLNSNCLIKPPSKYIKRLKVSLDSCDAYYWDWLTGRKGAFSKVVKNIKEAVPNTTVSITYTMTHENYFKIPEFIQFCQNEFKGLYAIFFSVYKGDNSRFTFDKIDIEDFYTKIRPIMISTLDNESRELFLETCDEKIRLMQGIRFPETDINKACYISLSERVVDPNGNIYGCSHLYRDGILIPAGMKHEKCRYGCNRRLVQFNEIVEKRMI